MSRKKRRKPIDPPYLPGTFDSHAHLDDPRFAEDLEETLDRARRVGVRRVLTVGAEPDGLESPVALARRHAGLFAAVGVHPHDARFLTDEILARMEALLQEPRVQAVGEVGLDYHYDRSPRPDQQSAFRAQIRLAKQVGRPLVVHVREAHEDALAILREEDAGQVGGVIHCFSGPPDLAAEYVRLGFFIGVTGVVTYKKAEWTKAVAASVPQDRLCVETDAPYLAPEPARGRRCEPAYVTVTARAIAVLRGQDPERIARDTAENAARLFGILPRDAAVGHLWYELGNNLYVNISNECDLDCTFCLKQDSPIVGGRDLRLARKPTTSDLLDALDESQALEQPWSDLSRYEEVVFCGLGEPTTNLDVILEAGPQLRKRGARRIRLDTDGLANLRAGRDVLSDLADAVDALSIRLNAPDPETYEKICPSKYGLRAYEAVVAFARRAKEYFSDVVLTAVELPDVDLEACAAQARKLGLPFRRRPMA